MGRSWLETVGHATGGVHAAAFGFSDPQHVLAPLRAHNAAGFVLLENEQDAAFQHHRDHGVNVHDELDKMGLRWERRKCNLWDPTSVAGLLKELVEELGGEPLHLNIAAGPNTVAVGATLASLYWDVRPYHAGGEKPHEPLVNPADTQWLPRFQAQTLSDRQLDVLEALSTFGKKVTGRKLKEKIRSDYARSFQNTLGETLQYAALHNRLTAAIHPLETLGAVKKTGTLKRMELEITADGMKLLQLYGRHSS